MITIEEKEKCCGCYSCYNACITSAISMFQDKEGFYYPFIDESKCVNCGLCEDVCPILTPKKIDYLSQVYACYRRDFDKRLKSASGGAFAVLAEQIIKEGGIVFGAALNEKFQLHHCSAINSEQLMHLLGSKYVQSQLDTIFQEIIGELETGRKVLFSGTPCQVQGLRAFLRKEYKNLICIDLICHGVPSPKIWESYLKEISKGEKIVNFIPRDKTNGINNAPLVFEFANGKRIRQKYNKNAYIKGFINDIYLRPSCYECCFKETNRASDITLGDFWGVEKEIPLFYDSYGVSAVIINSNKGRLLFQKTKDKMEFIESNIEQLAKGNPLLIRSAKKTEKREEFFSNWEEKGVIKTTRKMFRITPKERLIEIVEAMIYYLKQILIRMFRKKAR